MVFYSVKWIELGTRSSLSWSIATASGIAPSVISDPERRLSICVSEKLSWATRRVTTRPEDESYALIGLFGVNILPLYGEDRVNAFKKLQLEIMQASADHTLFAWQNQVSTGDTLAPQVSCFIDGALYQPVEFEVRIIGCRAYVTPAFTMTNVGVHIQLPCVTIPHHKGLYFVFLACKLKSRNDLVVICLQKRKQARCSSFFRLALEQRTLSHLRRGRDEGKRLLSPVDRFDLIYISAMRPHKLSRIDTDTRSFSEVHFDIRIKAHRP